MALKIDRVFIVGRDGKEMYLISPLDLEIQKLPVDGLVVSRRCKVQRKHRSFFMRLNPLHFDVPQRSRGKNSAGQFETFSERRLTPQFIHGRTSHHPVDGYQW